MSKDINEAINDYLNDLKDRKNNYKIIIKKTGDKERAKDETGMVPLNDKWNRFYDIKPIEEDHPLFRYVNNKVYLRKDDIEGVDTYLVYAGVVFDDHSKNFHIFPADKAEYDKLQDEFKYLKVSIIKEMENYSEFGKVKSGGGSFDLFENIKTVMSDKAEIGDKNIYQYIEVKKDGISYSINFMRYTCNAESIVGCTMRAIQFHKDTGKINLGGVCYPQTDKDFDFNTNSNGHVCYNPPVEWPTDGSSWNDQIEEIIGRFLDFIDNNVDFISNSERNKKGLGKDYLKNRKSAENL